MEIEVIQINSYDSEEVKLLKHILRVLRTIEHELAPKTTSFPTGITFTQENPMITEGPGVTQVWTASPLPAGSAFPAGTTFTATPSDPTVSSTLDPTGVILTIAYPDTFVADPASPFNVVVASSTFVPSPSTAPAQVSETVTPTAPPPATPTPTSFGFVQTT